MKKTKSDFMHLISAIALIVFLTITPGCVHLITMARYEIVDEINETSGGVHMTLGPKHAQALRGKFSFDLKVENTLPTSIVFNSGKIVLENQEIAFSQQAIFGKDKSKILPNETAYIRMKFPILNSELPKRFVVILEYKTNTEQKSKRFELHKHER